MRSTCGVVDGTIVAQGEGRKVTLVCAVERGAYFVFRGRHPFGEVVFGVLSQASGLDFKAPEY